MSSTQLLYAEYSVMKDSTLLPKGTTMKSGNIATRMEKSGLEIGMGCQDLLLWQCLEHIINTDLQSVSIVDCVGTISIPLDDKRCGTT